MKSAHDTNTNRTGPLGAALLLAAAAMMLSACNQDTSDLQAFIAETKARPAAPVAPFEEPEQAPSHRYPTGLERDPFSRLSFAEPRRTEETVSGPRPDGNRPRESLESYPLDALRMSGLLEREGDRWALVSDPQGTVHRVREGNYLGQNHGRIVSISERRIELLELVPTGERSWMERDAALATRER